jgi:hypothetical protein
MAERVVTRWGAVLLALAAALLGGCADLRLYSPSLDEQGKKAQKAWSDVDLTGLVQAERDRSAALLKAEVAYIQNQPMLSRDLELYGLVVGETDIKQGAVAPGLKSRVARRFQETAGDGKFYSDLKLARAREKRAKDAYADAVTELNRVKLEAPSCKAVMSGKSDDLGKDLQAPFDGIARGALASLKTACIPSAADIVEADKSEPDAVSKLLLCTTKTTAKDRANCLKGMPRLQLELEELAVLEARGEAERSAQLNERNAVKAASANYKKLATSAEGKETADAATPMTECTAKPAEAPAAGASAAAPAAPASAASAPKAGPNRTKLSVALERLKCAVAKLTGTNKYSLKLLSEERLSAVNEALDALLSPKAAGTKDETDKDRAGRALQRLAETADGWDKAKASADDVLARPLVAQQEIEELQQQALTRSIAIDTSEVELQRIRAQLTELQADHFKKAEGSLSTVTLKEGGFEAIFLGPNPAPGNTKALVMEGVAHYGHAIGYLQGQYQATKLQQQALVSARQMDLAENSLSQWDTLIRANVDMLAEWAAVGVKEDTISRGINALLLLWIGYGTNHP